MSKTIKISLAEPSSIIRKGLLFILKQTESLHLEVFEISDVEHLKDSLNWQKPDILIVSPSLLGLFSLQQLKKDAPNPDMKCVALQFSVTDGQYTKNYDQVISIYDSPEQINEKISNLIQAPESDKRHESLSQREKEVIVYVIKGMTNKQIADTLCLSTHTIITHRRNISAKLDIHSTAGLTIYSIVNKLVDIDQINRHID